MPRLQGVTVLPAVVIVAPDGTRRVWQGGDLTVGAVREALALMGAVP